MVNRTNFPWLMSNVVDLKTGQPLAGGARKHIVEWEGRKIGLIGLVEKEWLDTLATINPEEVEYTDYVEAGDSLVAELRQDGNIDDDTIDNNTEILGCEYVIALTHMRTPNDIRLAEQVQGVDLVLGGHDHVYEKTLVNNTWVLKSGTDFRQFSKITLDFRESPVSVEIACVDVTSSYEPDRELGNILEQFTGETDCYNSVESDYLG